MNRIKSSLLKATVVLFSILFSTLAVADLPTFTVAFSPSTIAPGSTSVMTYTINNTIDTSGNDTNPPVALSGVSFSNTFPTGMTVSPASNAVTSCLNGNFSATSGSNSVTFTDYRLGKNTTCTFSLNITSATGGTHTNTTSALSTSAGSVTTATADLTVDVSRPGFSMAFSPATISPGAVSTLIYTLDNSINGSSVNNLKFANTLPSGLTVASAPEATDTCAGIATINALPGTDAISLSLSALNANETCAVKVNVTATVAAIYVNTSGDLTQNGSNSSGPASASLSVEVPFLHASFPASASPGSSIKLSFSMTNQDRNNSATGITFTNDLNGTLSGLMATALPADNFCGTGSTLTGTSTITIANASLASGATCTFEVTVLVPTSAATGSYTNTTSIVNLTLDTATTKPAHSNTLLIRKAPTFTALFIDDPVNAASDVTLRYTITNTDSVNAATTITFTQLIDDTATGTIEKLVPNANSCGTGSTFSIGLDPNGLNQQVKVEDASLVAGGSCTFDFILTTAADITTGIYPFTTSTLSAVVAGSTIYSSAATDNLTIVAGPTLGMTINDNSVIPGNTTTVDFTLNYNANAPADITSLGFTLDLNSALSGLTSTTAAQNDICGSGSSFGGTSTLTLTGASLVPGTSCTFSITLQIPAGATPATIKLTTSLPTGTVSATTVSNAPATDDFVITGLTLTKQFLNDPTLPGATITLRYTIANSASAPVATAIEFSDNLHKALSGYYATTLPTLPCGAGSQMTGTTALTLSSGTLQPGTSCTFDVTTLVPASATEGDYQSSTSDGTADVSGVSGSTEFKLASDTLTIEQLHINVSTTASNPTSTSPIPVEIHFSRTVTNFVMGDLVIVNGTASNFLGSGLIYTVDITPTTTNGTVTIDVPANVADDTVNSTIKNPAATQLSLAYNATLVYPDPNITISDPSATHANSGPVTYTVTYANTTEISLAPSAITKNIVTGTDATVTVTNGTTSTPTVTFSSITGNGTLGFSIASGSARNGDKIAGEAGPSTTFIVDNIVPGISITDTVANPTNAPYTATFTFTEAVTGFVIGDITTGNANLSNFNAVSSIVYTATVTPTVTTGTVTLDVPAGKAIDTTGNSNTAATQYSVVYDEIAPTVVISGASGIINAPFEAIFTFSENVTDFVLADITVGNAVLSNFITASASVYKATITPVSDGPVTLDIAAGKAVDTAANNNTVATQLSVTYDATAPTVQISGPSGYVTAPFTATITFSEVIAGFALVDIAVTNATLGNLAETIKGTTYTVTVTPTADAVVTLDIAASSVLDTANNGNTVASQYSVTHDATQPTLVISGPVDGTQLSVFTATVTFNEDVTGFALADIVPVNATLSSFSATSATVYTLSVTPTSESTITLNVAASLAINDASLGNIVAPQYSVVYDVTAPTVSIDAPTIPQNAPFTTTVTFNEAVTGFATGDITSNTGPVSNFIAVSSTIYTATVTPVTDGTVTIDVAANTAVDIALNNNTAATQATPTYDSTKPTVVISATAGPVNTFYTATFTFSEDVTDFIASEITTTGNAGVSDFTATSAKVYTAKITPTIDGIVTLDVAAGVALDSASNTNTAATQHSLSYDGNKPTVTITGTADPVNTTFPLTIEFNETVTGFVEADLTVVNADLSSFTETITGKVYTVNVTPKVDGLVTIDIASNVASDIINGNDAATQYSVSYDGTKPGVSISATSGPVNTSFSAAITFSEGIIGFIITDITAGNATLKDFVAVSTTNYTVTVTPSAEGEVTLDIAAGVAADSATNTNTAATQHSLSFDGSKPTVTITATTGPVNTTFPVTIEFNETVTGFVEADLTVVNADLTSFTETTTGKIYTVNVTPKVDGLVTIDIASNVANDIINGNDAATQYSVSYDGTKPTVTISAPSGPVNISFSAAITFSEGVTGFIITDITAGNATLKDFVAVSTTNYTVTVTPSIEGEVTLDIAAGVAADSATNLNVAATQFKLTYDVTGPKPVITGTAGPINAPITITITYPEDVTGFTVDEITVTNATVGSFVATNAKVYTAIVAPINNGAVTVDIAANVAIDTATNNNTAAAQYTVEYDNLKPSIIVTGPTGPLNTSFTATLTASQKINGFAQTHITATNATLSNFATSETLAYTVLVTPTSDGAVTVSVAEGLVADDASNTNAASNVFTLTYDITKPTIQTLLPANNAVDVALTPTLVLTFDELITAGTSNNLIEIKDLSTNAVLESIATNTSAVSISDKVVTVTFSTILPDYTTHYVTIGTGAFLDTSTNVFAGVTSNTTWQFRVINLPPVPAADTALLDEDTSINIPVLANDDGKNSTLNPSSVIIDTPPTNGQTVVNTANGSITYTTNANYHGTDTFTYIVSDIIGTFSTATTVTVTAHSINDAPVANNDETTTAQNTSVTVNVLSNDTDVDGVNDINTTSLVITSHPQNGVATVSNGKIVYQPTTGYSGADIFNYAVSDEGALVSNIATVSLNVSGTNTPPTTVTDTATTSEDTPVTINVLTNDSDSDGSITTDSVAIMSYPGNGTVAVQVDGTVIYTPELNYSGSDSFSYTVKDNSGAVSTSASVSLTISSVNDAPVANNDTVVLVDKTTAQIINVIGNDTDADGTLTALSIVSPPQFGTAVVDTTLGLITYTAGAGFAGSDSFTYQITDNNNANSSPATVTLSETTVNLPPLANNDNVQTGEDLFIDINVLANDSDTDGILVQSTLLITTAPLHGTANARLSDGHIFYTPTANFTGDDTLVYQISDNNGGAASATVSIRVNNVNDTPVAIANSVQTNEDTLVDITLTSTDADGDTISYHLNRYPTNGTLTGTPPRLSYLPNANYNGSDSFTYFVNDGTADSAAANITITVNAQNDTPIANTQSVQVVEDTPLSITLTGSDVDNDTLTYLIGNTPVNGTLSGTGANQTYTPNANFTGADSFTFVTNDATVNSIAATVTITVTGLNDAPVANNQTVNATEDTALAIVLSASDADNDTLTYAVDTQPLNGQLTGTAPNLNYTPNLNFNGTDSFTFIANDSALNSQVALVSITVAPVNDQPIANNLNKTGFEDAPISITLTGGDVDADTLTYTIVGNPTNGTLSGQTPNMVYTPQSNFNGNDTFTFIANDGTVNSVAATVSITIQPVNDTPVGVNDTFSFVGWAGINMDVLANDTDVDGDTLTISGAIAGSGTVTFTPSLLTFTPVNGFVGATTIEYFISDGNTGVGSAIVNITIGAPNNNLLATINVPADIQINANALLTKVDLGKATATDKNGSPIAVSLVNDTTFFKPGINTVYWQATDSKGQTTTASQRITVSPLISLDSDQVAMEGYAIKVAVRLNGSAPVYPLSIPYSISGTADLQTDHNLTDGILSIESGTEGYITLSAFADNVVEGQETIVITLDESLNLGQNSVHTIVFSEQNIAPKVELKVSQLETINQVVNREDGLVQINANISHPNPNKLYSYQWTNPEQVLTNVASQTNELSFDPAELTPGLYHFELMVTDLDDSQYQVREQITIKVAQYAVALGTDDSDNDGIADLIEGTGDSDNDGIANYLDAIAACNVMPGTLESATNHLVEGDSGVCLRLGDVALARTAEGTRIDSDSSDVNGLFDFVAYKLPIAGQNFSIALPQSKPIPANAIYRQQMQTNLWVDFIEDANNQVMSAPGESGYCPPPGDIKWEAGLVEGYWCVQLQINDGGPNDADGEANNTIVSPGGVATLVSNSQPEALDDVSNTRVNAPITFDVLANDSDGDGDELQISSANAVFGTVSIVDNQLQYQPALDMLGVDTVVYGVSDAQGGSASATLTIDVMLNGLPIANQDMAAVASGQTVTIDVLANDTDPEDDSLMVTTATSDNGAVSISADNRLIYQPNANFTGTDIIEYLIDDGFGGEAPGMVSVTVAARTSATAQTNSTTTSSGGGSLFWMLLLCLGVFGRRVIVTPYRPYS